MPREPVKSGRETGRAKAQATATARSKNGESDKTADARPGAESIELLKAQHRDLQATLAKRSEANANPVAIAEEFGGAWLPHLAVEQEILVPAAHDAGVDEDIIAGAAIQKDIINLLLADLLRDEDRRFSEAKLEALARQFDGLVAGADGEEGGLFAAASSAKASSPDLTAQVKAGYERFKERFANLHEGIGEALVMLAPRRLSVVPRSRQNRREYEMSRYSNMRERDDQGRFMSDDDRGYSRGGPERDEYGRFESSSRSRRRDDDDDERYGPRSMARDRDDEGRFTRRGGSSEGRGHGGWFGDSEGHSEASRRGWDDPRHGDSGWYGDPEGHSEASRRGWDDPRHGNYRSRSPRYDDDDRRYESRRSRSDDDYDRGNGGRGRGHGGWSGDPEGHSEASRRGWEHRR